MFCEQQRYADSLNSFNEVRANEREANLVLSALRETSSYALFAEPKIKNCSTGDSTPAEILSCAGRYTKLMGARLSPDSLADTAYEIVSLSEKTLNNYNSTIAEFNSLIASSDFIDSLEQMSDTTSFVDPKTFETRIRESTDQDRLRLAKEVSNERLQAGVTEDGVEKIIDKLTRHTADLVLEVNNASALLEKLIKEEQSRKKKNLSIVTLMYRL